MHLISHTCTHAPATAHTHTQTQAQESRLLERVFKEHFESVTPEGDQTLVVNVDGKTATVDVAQKVRGLRGWR